MRPTSYPEGWSNKDSDNEKHKMVPQLWTINGKCPKNSIPIRRTRKEDILRAKSIERFGKKDPNNIHQHKPTNPTNNDGTHEVHISFIIFPFMSIYVFIVSYIFTYLIYSMPYLKWEKILLELNFMEPKRL